MNVRQTSADISECISSGDIPDCNPSPRRQQKVHVCTQLTNSEGNQREDGESDVMSGQFQVIIYSDIDAERQSIHDSHHTYSTQA